MTDIALAEFLKPYTQQQAATLLCVTQGTISQMLTRQRAIFVVASETGTFSYYEVKRPRKRAA